MKYEVVGSQSAVMAEGEESSSGSGDSRQDDPAPIPHVDFPQLHFAEGGVSPENFIPTCLSNFTNTLGSMGPSVGGPIAFVGWGTHALLRCLLAGGHTSLLRCLWAGGHTSLLRGKSCSRQQMGDLGKPAGLARLNARPFEQTCPGTLIFRRGPVLSLERS